MTKPVQSEISAGLRRFLYITALITGAAVLIVEILGAKMLSPYVGTSHFVWTAQIAVTLLSLATGYYFGGWLVDRSSKLSRLYLCLLIASAYLALTVLVVDKIAYAFLELNLALGALLSSATLFFIPLTLLAATGPFLVKVLASSLNIIGRQVGRLSAISTIGSVAGTILIGYVLIPFLPNSVTMFITSAILALLALFYFAVWGRARTGAAVTLLLTTAIVGGIGVYCDLNRHPKELKQLYRGNSNFGMLQVMQTPDGLRQYYLNDYLVQNTYLPKERESASLFTYMLHRLARGYNPKVHDVLCIGMGVGIVPMSFAREGAAVTVVEINPNIVPVAEKFFNFHPSKVKLNIQDGRYYLHTVANAFDAVVLDAFLGDASPSHLMTREAFASMKRAMRPDGVLVINSFGDFVEGRNFMVTSLHRTLRSVFNSVRIHATGNGNVFFVATDQKELRFNPPRVETAPRMMQDEIQLGYNSIMTLEPDKGSVLTDDFNPTDFFDAANREQHRRTLALSMQNL